MDPHEALSERETQLVLKEALEEVRGVVTKCLIPEKIERVETKRGQMRVKLKNGFFVLYNGSNKAE